MVALSFVALPFNLTSSDIHHQMPCPNTHSQNGRAERKHGHMTEMGLALLFHSCVPICDWIDAFSYITNQLPALLHGGISPFEILHGKPPFYTNFHPFGSKVYSYLCDYDTNKSSPHNIPFLFLGYSPFYKGFHYLDPLPPKSTSPFMPNLMNKNFPYYPPLLPSLLHP